MVGIVRALSMYLPMIGASSFFTLLGHLSGRVMMAVASASLQAHVRAPLSARPLRHRPLRRQRVLRQVRDDQIDGHRVVIGVPAVVVRTSASVA
jgi:hypothetical protein